MLLKNRCDNFITESERERAAENVVREWKGNTHPSSHPSIILFPKVRFRVPTILTKKEKGTIPFFGKSSSSVIGRLPRPFPHPSVEARREKNASYYSSLALPSAFLSSQDNWSSHQFPLPTTITTTHHVLYVSLLGEQKYERVTTRKVCTFSIKMSLSFESHILHNTYFHKKGWESFIK